MANKELIEEVGKYIDKYYEPGTDDIKMDEEMKSVFDKITSFRKKRKKQKKQEAPADYETDMSAPAEFDVGSMKKTKITKEMSQTMATNRNIDDLMNQIAIAHIANKRIEIDLDDGVKVNYAKFQGVEVAQEGKKTLKVDLLAKIK